MIFKKKQQISVDLIDFNAMNIGTGNVGSYIKWLYCEYGFLHIGYRFENQNGNCRFVLHTLPENRNVMQYFKDRCPAMVEIECKSKDSIPHKFVKWENGFEEVEV